MRLLLFITGGALGLLILTGLIFYFIGRTLPERHSARVTLLVRGTPATVWGVITAYGRMPEWWPAVKSIRTEVRPNGETWTWNRDSRGGEIAFRTTMEQAPTHLVREIVGENLPFGGTWTFDLSADGANTRLTLTEDGFIKPPLFRFVGTHLIGLDKTMKDFTSNLEKKLGGPVQ